jgi:hypothetical protein
MNYAIIHGYVVHHRHGTDVFLGATDEEARKKVYEFVTLRTH